MCPCIKFHWNLRTLDIRNKFSKNHMNDKNFEKNKQYANKHIAIYPCTKFQLNWRTSDFWTKLAQKKYE